MNSEISMKLCDAFKAAAIECIASDSKGECSSCIDLETFPTYFPSSIENIFMSTQVYAVPGTPRFCDVANSRVCTEVGLSTSCCCQDSINLWKKCLIENVYSQQLNLPEPCTSTCQTTNGMVSESSSSMPLSVGPMAGIAGTVLILAVLALIFCRAIVRSCLQTISSSFKKRRTVKKNKIRNSLKKRQPKHQKDNENTLSQITRNTTFDIEEGGSTCESENSFNGGLILDDDESDDDSIISEMSNLQQDGDDEEELSYDKIIMDLSRRETSSSLPVVKVVRQKEVEEDDVDKFIKTGKEEILKLYSAEEHDVDKFIRTGEMEKQHSSEARNKKHAIEAWCESKKKGSKQTLQEFIAAEQDDHLDNTRRSNGTRRSIGSHRSNGTQRSKKEAIEAFIESRKMGSNRSLRSFVSGEESQCSISSDEESLYTSDHNDDEESNPTIITFAEEAETMQFALASLSLEIESDSDDDDSSCYGMA